MPFCQTFNLDVDASPFQCSAGIDAQFAGESLDYVCVEVDVSGTIKTANVDVLAEAVTLTIEKHFAREQRSQDLRLCFRSLFLVLLVRLLPLED
jgi:hypothetical protein